MQMGICTLAVLTVSVVKRLDLLKKSNVLGMLMRLLVGQAVVFMAVTFAALAA